MNHNVSFATHPDPCRHENLEDFKKTLEIAFMYAKTVTLGKTHWPQSNRVMQRNRRIGCSMSGIAQFIASKGMHELKVWSDEGYKHIQVRNISIIATVSICDG